jgi:hypothetical protein
MVHDIARWTATTGPTPRRRRSQHVRFRARHHGDARSSTTEGAGSLRRRLSLHRGWLPARGIARWDGESWSPLGEGIGAVVDDFAVMNNMRGPSLFAAGEFQTVGAGTSYGVVQWVGCPNCYANCDLSTRAPVLNVNDFICFVNKFAAKDPYANCSVDAVIDVNDFNCFLSKSAAGCP